MSIGDLTALVGAAAASVAVAATLLGMWQSRQAGKVTAWITETDDSREVATTRAALDYPDLMVHNASGLLVYELRFFLWVQLRGSDVPVLWQVRNALAPSEEPVVASKFLEGDAAEAAMLMNAQAVSITFRDAAGHWWRRTPNGKLRPIVRSHGALLAARGVHPIPVSDPALRQFVAMEGPRQVGNDDSASTDQRTG